MAIFTIGDLHLSFNDDKPMSVFGENWEGYEDKIKKDWIEKVKENDLVVISGDFSWSMYLENTYLDFSYINKLPGKKLLLKGNHDYWWSTLKKMRDYLEEKEFQNIDFIYNNAYEYENKIIVGTRGWSQSEEKEDKKILDREKIRLELSIKDGIEKYGDEKEVIAFMHYPPIIKHNITENEPTDFIRLMQKYNIKRCYYGHLHSTSIKEAVEGEYFGINFKLVSADGIEFKLVKI